MVQLDPLRVDQHQAGLVRRRVQEHRAQHRVDAARLARPGGAGDQRMRHRRQIGPHGLPGDVLAEPHGERRGALRTPVVDVAEPHQAPALVRHLHADRLLAGDRRQDPDVGGGERVGEIVAKLGDLRDLGPGSELKLVAADVRAADHPQQLGLDAEVAQRLEQRLGDRLAILHVRARVPLAPLEQLRGGQLVVDLLGRGDRPRACCPSASGRPPGRLSAAARAPRIPGAATSPVARLVVGDLRALDLLLCPLPVPLICGRPGLHLAGVGLTAQHICRKRLGGIGAGDRDLVAARVEALEARAAGSHRLRQVARSGAGGPRDPPGAGQQPRDGGPGEQQQAAGEHQHGQDLGAEPLEERGRRPVQGLAGGPAVDGEEALLEVAVADRVVGPQPGGLGREGQEQRGEQQDAARVQRPGGGDERAHDQRQAPTGEGQRRDVRDPAGGVLERPLQPLAHRSSVPADVEDATQVDAGRHQPEPDQVEVALLEPFGQGVRITTRLAQPRARPRPRRDRAGLRRAGRAACDGACVSEEWT